MRLQNILICILLAAIGTVPIGCISAKKSRLQTGGPEQPKVRKISAEEERTIMEQTNKMFAVGLAAEQQGDLKAAEWAYVQCLQYNQKKESIKFVGPPYHRLAVITARQGKTEKSEQYFRKALEYGSENPELACDFAQMLIDDGREKEATTILENALITYPKNKKLLFFLGHTLAIQNREIEALRRLKVAVGESEAYHELAQILREKGNSRGAELMEEKGRVAKLENRKPIIDLKERLKDDLNQELTEDSSMELLTYSSKTPKMGSINRRYMGILEGNGEAAPKPETQITAAPEVNPTEVMQKYGRPEFMEAPLPNPSVSTAQPKFSDINPNRNSIAAKPVDETYPAPTIASTLPAAPPIPPRQALAARPNREIAAPSDPAVQTQGGPSASELLAKAGKSGKPIAIATPNLALSKEATVFEPPTPNTDFSGRLVGDPQPVQQVPPQITPAIPSPPPTKKEVAGIDPFKPETEIVIPELPKIALRENSVDSGFATTKPRQAETSEPNSTPNAGQDPLPFEDDFLNTPIEPVLPSLEPIAEPPKESTSPANEVLPNLNLSDKPTREQAQTGPTLPEMIPNPRLDLPIAQNSAPTQSETPPQNPAQTQVQPQPQVQAQPQANTPKSTNRVNSPKSGQYSNFGPSQRKPVPAGSASTNSRPTQIAIAAPPKQEVKQELRANAAPKVQLETPPPNSTLIVETTTIPEPMPSSGPKEPAPQASSTISALRPEERFADKIGLPHLGPRVAMRTEAVPSITSTNEPIVQKLDEPKIEPKPQPEFKREEKIESKPEPTPAPIAPPVDKVVEKTIEPKIERKPEAVVELKPQTALPLQKPQDRPANRRVAVPPKPEPPESKPSQPEPSKSAPANPQIAQKAEPQKAETVAEPDSLKLPMPQLELLTKLYGPDRPEQRPAPPVIPPATPVEVKQAKPEPKVAIADPAEIESRKSLTFNEFPKSQAKFEGTASTKDNKENTVFAPVSPKSVESDMKISLSPQTETSPTVEKTKENEESKQVLKIVDAEELKSPKRLGNEPAENEIGIEREIDDERVVVKLGSTPEETTLSPRSGNKPVSFSGEIVQLKIERPWNATDSETKIVSKTEPKAVANPAAKPNAKTAPKKLLKVQSGSKSASDPTIELKSTPSRTLSVRSFDAQPAQKSDERNDPNRKELTLRM